jgi:phosphate/sulfate permease
MAWNIGANDVSNAMGTSVGSGALTLKKAVLIAAVLEFSGAFFVGSNVSETMQRGLLDTSLFAGEPMILILGMCAALFGTSLWLQVASYFGWPVSTTHAIVGAILGFGGVVGGIDAIRWGETGSIALSWIVSPLLSALVSYLFFSLLQRNILYAMSPIEASKRFVPLLGLIATGTFTLSLIFNGLDNLNIHFSVAEALAIALSVGLVAYAIAFFLVRRIPNPLLEGGVRPSRHLPQTVVSLDKALKHLQRVHAASFDEAHTRVGEVIQEMRSLSDTLRQETHFVDRSSEYHTVEKAFIYLQILSACFVAFAHGANDVANAIGPVAAVLAVIKQGVVSDVATIPPWLLAFGGIGIVVGLATWGWRVIQTIGKKITELTPTRGFCAEFGAAITILIASKLGIPVSTTHCLVGAVIGVGLAKGLRALNLNILREIILSWIITIPASAGVSILLFYALKAIFL